MSTFHANNATRVPIRIVVAVVLFFVSFIELVAFADGGSEKSHAEDRAALNGTWDGVWFSPTRGFVYTAEMHLKVDARNNVQGHIKWTLKNSPRVSEQTKIGLTGVEYVSGTYNSRCKILSINGEKKDDPHTILGLDKYRLLLAENRIALGGITRSHGTWRGAFSLGRRMEE